MWNNKLQLSAPNSELGSQDTSDDVGLGARGREAAIFISLLPPDFWFVAFRPKRDPGSLLAIASIGTLANLDIAIAEI